MRNVLAVCAMMAAGSTLGFENGEIVFDVPLGNVDTWIAQQGTGTVVKAGAGGLTLTDPALFGGAVVLQGGTLSLAASGAAPAARPDAILANAAFHVDASEPASLTAPGGAVAAWADVRGGAYPVATPPGVAPDLLPGALNGLPVVDFGRLAWYTGEERGLHWSQRFNGTIKAAFWVVGSRHGHGFLLGDSTVYHFHPNNSISSLWAYSTPSLPVFNASYLPEFFRTGEAQLGGQDVEPTGFGLSGAWDVVSLLATNTATAGGTASRFANDRNNAPQGGAQALAECIVFESAVTPVQRDEITAYLTDKWFRGPDLRVLRLDGGGALERADSAAPRINVLTGDGTLAVDGPATLDAVFLNDNGTVTLGGAGADYSIGLVRGVGTLASVLPLNLQSIGLINGDAITLDTPVAGDTIPEVFGGGALTIPPDIVLGTAITVSYAPLAVTNGAAPLSVTCLTGQGILNTSGCGALSITNLVTAVNALNPTDYYRTTVQAGASTVYVDTLTGNGSVLFQNTTGLITIRDASAFTGELYLADGVSAEILIPPAQPIRSFQAINASLDCHGATLAAPIMYARGTLTLNGDLNVSVISLTGNLDITCGGSGLLLFDEIRGNGSLTVNRPYYAPVVTLTGNTLSLSSNVFDSVSGFGTLALPAAPAIIGEMTVTNTLTIQNSGLAVNVTAITAQGTATLVAGGGALTLGTATLPDRQTLSVTNGTGTVTVGAFSGTGFFLKNGTGDFHFPVPNTLRNLKVEGGAIFPARISPPALPPSVVPAFWLDASASGTVTADASGNVTRWDDVRAATLPGTPYATSSGANAPFVIPAAANGLPVISTGEYWSGRFLLWSETITVRSFFMACGSHEGMGYFLGNSAKNNWNRNVISTPIPRPNVDGHATCPYVCQLWNIDRGANGTATHLRDGRSYVNGDRIVYNALTPFSGGTDIFTYINDVTDVDVDANQFSRYMTSGPSYSGGARFGEVIICTNIVTEAERAAIEGYLQSKWVGDIRRLELAGPATLALAGGETLSVDVACGEGSLAQTGPGTLKVSNAALLVGGLDIRDGALAFARTDRAVSYYPDFHLDATAADTVSTNQYGYVTNWADIRFNGRYAWATNGVSSMEPPNLLTAAGPHGKPVVDFNFYGNWSSAPTYRTTNNNGTVIATSAHYTWLAFNQEATNRTAFWMLGSQNGGGFLLGHSSRYDFHRGVATRGNDTTPALFGTYTSTDGNQRPAHNGFVYVDGARVDARQTDVLNGDYQLVQLVTDGGAMYANQFSRDRVSNVKIGGQRLGEVALFDRALTEKERLNTEAALSAKWFGDIRAVRFAPGTVFDTGTSTSAVRVAHFGGEGTVTHTGPAVLRLLEPSSFTGTLATRLDTLDVALMTPPDAPAPGASLWIDPSDPRSIATNGLAVTTVTDLSGNGIPLTFRDNRAPTVLPGELNGLPVLDLGPINTAVSVTFLFPRGSLPVHSWVAVHGSQEGGGNFMGDGTQWPFYREASNEGGTANPYARLFYYSDSLGSFIGNPLYRGWTFIDGLNVNGKAQGFAGGYSLYTPIPLEDAAAPWVNVDRIAGDRASNSRGGMRLGEALVYPRRISDADRVQTEAYLNSKWLARPSYGYAALKTPMLPHIASLGGALRIPEGHTAVLGKITGGAVTVEGGGGLVLTSGGSGAADVGDGTLTLTPTVPVSPGLDVTAGLTFHVDASVASSLTLGPSNTVTRWDDVRGAGFPYAFADGSTYVNPGNNAIPGGIPVNPPTLAPDAVNGLPAVDFGPGATNSTVWMIWDQPLSPIRSAFWVVRTPFPSNNGGVLLSALGDGNSFARGKMSTTYETPRPLWLLPTMATQTVTRNDGSLVNGTKSGLDNAWHVVSLTTLPAYGYTAQAFGADRPGRVEDLTAAPGFRCGGILYAEVLLYNRVLSENEVKAVEAYLTAKWFRSGTPGATFDGETHGGENITLGAGGTLVLDGVPQAAVAVSGPGTVMDAAVPPTVWQVNGPRVFDRGLILADTATVYIDYDGNAPAADRIDVTGGLTVQGSGTFRFSSVTNWLGGASAFPVFSYDTLTGGGNWSTLWRGVNGPNGATVKGTVDESGQLLNAEIIPSGLIMILK